MSRPEHRGCRTVGECQVTLGEAGLPSLPGMLSELFAVARGAAALLDEVDALRERLRYEPEAFCRIGRALREAQREAVEHGHAVFLRFDGVPLTVDPDSDIEAMEAGYDDQLTAWHKAKRSAAADDGAGRATAVPGFPRGIAHSIRHNEHRTSHETVAQYVAGEGLAADMDPGDLTKAIEADDLWVIQWYPETAIGFHRVAAATLERAMEKARGVVDGGPTMPDDGAGS